MQIREVDHVPYETPDLPASDLEKRVTRTGRQLRQAIAELIEASPGKPRRPVELCGALNVNKDLSSKVLKALRQQDPIAALRLMPGPEGLRSLIQAAARCNVDDTRLDAAREAVADFDELVRGVAGSRAHLDAIVSSWLPEAREQFELRHKQAVFTGISNLKGVAADVSLQVGMIGPGTEEGYLDTLSVIGLVGLRRLRIGTPINLTSAAKGTESKSPIETTLDGRPVTEDPAGLFLEPYCSQPMPEIVVSHCGKLVHHLLGGNSVGLQSAVDVFMAEQISNLSRLESLNPPKRRLSVSAEIELPVKTIVFDMLLHRDIWPNCDVELAVYDSSFIGDVDPNLPENDIRRMHQIESMQSLGTGVSHFRIAEVPHYVDILRDVCNKRGWNPDAFRCYRCHSQYPVYGSQYQFIIDRG